MMQTQATSLDDILTVRAFAKRYPLICTEPSLRWQIFQGDDNGLFDAGAIIQIGGYKNGKILIDAPRYLDWVVSHRSTNS